MAYFNVGSLFSSPGQDFVAVPFASISERSTDIPVPYYQGISRLYLLSNEYYGNPHYEQLILLANPEWVSEHDIPDGTMLRIPYPLDSVLQEIGVFQSTWVSNQQANAGK